MCDPSVSNPAMLQKVFSVSSQLHIAVYSYSNYSQLNVTMNITSTPCRVARLHLCAWPQMRSHIWNLVSMFEVLRGKVVFTLDLTKAECSVLQFTTDIHTNVFDNLRLRQEIYMHSIMCKLTFRLEKIIHPPQMFLHELEGFLFNSLLTNSYALKQHFAAAGHDFIHDAQTDVSVTDWDSKGIHSILNHSKHAQLHKNPAWCSWLWGYCPMSITLKGLKSRTFHVKYHSVFPSHKKSLKFMFSGLRGRSWLDIHLKGSKYKTVIVDETEQSLVLFQRWTEVKAIEDNRILILKTDQDKLISKLRVKIQMQVIETFTSTLLPHQVLTFPFFMSKILVCAFMRSNFCLKFHSFLCHLVCVLNRLCRKFIFTTTWGPPAAGKLISCHLRSCIMRPQS